ncbi:MAG: glycoside hydrolase family 78 protein [Clostridia bacterium]|nr:glycoside hydrolase family 78 protein [Clostridia bacterium]
MKKLISVFLTAILCFTSLAVGSVPAAAEDNAPAVSFGFDVSSYPTAEAGDVAGNLRVNYETSPNCVSEAPVFSWNLISSVRGARQTAYRVRVAESPAALDGGSLVWDSGTVTSDEDSGIVCGAGLREATTYYWDVAVINERGETVVGGPSSFVTALTGTGFDGASWIRTAGESRVNAFQKIILRIRNFFTKIANWFSGIFGRSVVTPSGSASSAPMLRGSFTVDGGISSAKLFVSAAGIYDAYVNGARITESALNPGQLQFDQRVTYQCYDVTSLLRTGKNTVGAVLGRGWYLGAGTNFGGDAPALIGKLVVDCDNGERKTFCTDGSWKYSTDGPVLADDIFDGETYDARKEVSGWSSPEFDDSGWANVRVTDAASLHVGALSPQIAGLIRPMDTLTAKSVSKVGTNVYIYDFGQNLTGVAEITLHAAAGTVVTLRHGEMLNDGKKGSDGKAGTLYTANLRGAKATDVYTCKGAQDGETYSPRFTYHGFRYLEISGLSSALPPEDVRAIVIYSDLEDTGALSTSDVLLNQLVSNTYWGQRGNFLSVPTDCPQRNERRGWTGDAQIFCGTASYNMNTKAFFDSYITVLNDGQRANGCYPDFAPDVWPVASEGTATNGWMDAAVIIPWTTYLRYGDASCLSRYYGNMKRYTAHLLATSDGYVRSRSAYGDWLSVGETTDIAVIDTAYCVCVMDLMAKIADLLGKTADAAEFRTHAQNYRSAWISRFVSGNGTLTCDTQTAYLLALGFDILPEGDRQAFADRLAEKIRQNGNRLTTGFLGCPLLLPVLTRFGHTDTAFALLQQEEYPSWKYPILQGATTVWERWNSYTVQDGFGDAGMNSFNHYAYGSVTGWLYDTLVGIRCDEAQPGFRHIILNPTCGGGLTHAEGAYLSIRGLIKSAWEAEEDVMTAYRCTVPANATATLYLSASDAEAVTESGRPLTEAEGITVLSSDGGTVELLLTGGAYSFLIAS